MFGKVENKLKKTSISFVLILVLFVIVKLSWGYRSSVAINGYLKSMNHQQLQEEKLRQEIQKLQLENEKIRSHWELIRSYSPFLTAFVALIGVLATIWKQIYESSKQKELDRAQREADSVRRLDEKFTSIVTGLGSESEAIQASAAVSIITFLRSDYKAFHDQVFSILLANLKIPHPDQIHKLLVTAFNIAIRIQLERMRKKGRKIKLDLSNSYLNRVDLSGLDISEADLAFAKLRSANLTDTNLRRARGIETNLEKARLSRANLNEARFRKARFQKAQFHGANIVSAHLEDTDLRDAQFQQAKMQGAHLDNAKLGGAKFEEANLSDTFFYDASLNMETLKSIISARKWQKAHFNEEIKAKLEELAENRG